MQKADYIIHFDGGSEGNPGPMRYAWLLTRTRDKATRRGSNLELGQGTNNQAEYLGLIAALEELISIIEGAGRSPREFSLEVRGDSRLVMRQIAGRWRCRSANLRPLYDRARTLLARFGDVTYKEVPRAVSVEVLGI